MIHIKYKQFSINKKEDIFTLNRIYFPVTRLQIIYKYVYVPKRIPKDRSWQFPGFPKLPFPKLPFPKLPFPNKGKDCLLLHSSCYVQHRISTFVTIINK